MGKHQTHNRTSQTRAKLDIRNLNFKCVRLSEGLYATCADPERETGGPDPLENYKATKPAVNVWLLLNRQRHLKGDSPRGPMMARF